MLVSYQLKAWKLKLDSWYDPWHNSQVGVQVKIVDLESFIREANVKLAQDWKWRNAVNPSQCAFR